MATPTAPAISAQQSTRKGVSGGIIAAIVVPIVFAIAGIAAAACWFFYRRRKAAEAADSEKFGGGMNRKDSGRSATGLMYDKGYPSTTLTAATRSSLYGLDQADDGISPISATSRRNSQHLIYMSRNKEHLTNMTTINHSKESLDDGQDYTAPLQASGVLLPAPHRDSLR